MRVVLSGGGTAGHVNPAIAIAQIIKENISDAEIFFVGTKSGYENQLVPKEGFPLYHTKAMGIKRSLSPKNLYALFLAYYSPKKTKRLIKKLSPDVVIGTGGYVCWPVLKAASECNVPTMLHESNAYPGLTVRMLEKCTDRIMLNFEEAKSRLKCPEKCVVTGNPMRTTFSSTDRASARRALGLSDDDRLILSFGGSRGAEALNAACIEMMADYVVNNEKTYHIHATGKDNYDACIKAYNEKVGIPCSRIEIKSYIYNMPELMSAADVVISRAGAMSISEISLMGKACILVPYPAATDNHQLKNAQALANEEAAILVEEKELSSSVLTNHVKNVIDDSERRSTLEANVRKFSMTDANRRVFEEITKLLKKK